MSRVLERSDVQVPASVPSGYEETYIDNFLAATNGTGRLVLFAGDQKIEHLNADFKGEGISPDDSDPEHLFMIASKAHIGCFAAQHGLIARYARKYPDIPYLIKMNSKSPLVPTEQQEPVSLSLIDFEHVLALRESGVNVRGIGYTIYLGSELEAHMFQEAGRLIADAHMHGLLVVLWIYPRGKAVADERSPSILAGAAGVGATLGADFVKINEPIVEGHNRPDLLRDAVLAAGNCGVITAGGSAKDEGAFLNDLWRQLNESGTRGSATGRNVHQRSLADAVSMADAIACVVWHGYSVHDAWLVASGQQRYPGQ